MSYSEAIYILQEYWIWAYGCIAVAGFVAAIHAIMRSPTTQSTIAWVVVLLIIPLPSLPLYILFGGNRLYGYVKVRRAKSRQIRTLAEQRDALLKPFWTSPQMTITGDTSFDQIGIASFLKGHRLSLLQNGQEFFPAVYDRIDQASDYILLQSYIIVDDGVGDHLANHLIAAAQRGVRVYVLYDSIASRLGRKYLKRLRKAGIQINDFNPSKLWLPPLQLNFRNHRKLVIIDGVVAFIGGLNFGEEYEGKLKALSPWRDTHLMFQGPGVIEAQMAFYEDWYWASETLLELKWEVNSYPQDQRMIVLATGPADSLENCQLAFLEMIRVATKNLWLATPYFIPDRSVIAALQLARLRGVDVKLILPGITDSRIASLASESFFEELIPLGIEIYFYQNGFMHQKVALSDQLVMIGSSNIDNRSFRLNFELMSIINDKTFAQQVKNMLTEDLTSSRRVQLEEITQRSFWHQLMIRSLRLLAPIL